MANVLYFSLSNERIKLMLLHIRWILSVLNRDSNKIISNEKKIDINVILFTTGFLQAYQLVNLIIDQNME